MMATITNDTTELNAEKTFTLNIPDVSGHSTFKWKNGAADDFRIAADEFERLKAKGYGAYGIDSKDPAAEEKSVEIIRSLADLPPGVDTVTMVPVVIGG